MSKKTLLMLTTCALVAVSPAKSQESTSLSAPQTVLDLSQLTTEITALDREIEAAEADIASYEGGLIQVMVKSRIETLRLTKAILQNRIIAQEGGETIEIVVLGGQPDPELASRILVEIEAQTELVGETARQVAKSGSGGLIGALTVSRLETEKMNLAVLRSSWYRATYGVIAPALAVSAEVPPASAPVAPLNGQDLSVVAPIATVEWADPAYPDIDYSRSIFEQLNREGFKISGWWGVSETKAEVDDSSHIFAINVSRFEEGFQVNTPKLTLGCREGTASVIYDTDDYLLTDYSSDTIPVTWRIDDQEAVSNRWSKITTNDGAGLFERQGEKMIRDLYDAKSLFVRIVENNGTHHDATFDLSGGKAAFDAAAAACGFTTLNLGEEEYRAIQALLNAGGFSAGTPDGQWGSGSQRALRAFQESVGLPETGAPDRVTLEKLGLAI